MMQVPDSRTRSKVLLSGFIVKAGECMAKVQKTGEWSQRRELNLAPTHD